MRLIFTLICLGLYKNIYCQNTELTLKYFIPKHAVAETRIDNNGVKEVTYWADSNDIGMKIRPLGQDYFDEKGMLVDYVRHSDSLSYSVTYRHNGIISYVNITCSHIVTLISYHKNGKIAFSGSYNTELNTEENNEIGSHCEYDETGQLMSFKLYDNGVLISEIHYK